jgi:hypothetical protein
MLKKYRRILGATIVVPAVLLAAGCGPAGLGSGAAETSSVAAATSTVAGRVYSDKAGFIAALKASTKDVKTVHMVMKMSGQGQEVAMEGDSRLDPGSPASKLTMSVAGMNLDLVAVDKKIYVKGVPGQDPTKWAVLDENSPMAKQLASSASQLDPSQMYDEFDKALTDVKHVGKETVDGEAMEKYELTMDTKSIPDMPTGEVELPKTLTYLVWLDEKDRMRKVSFDVMGVSALVTLSGYGAPVAITAPPADQTVKAKL